MNTIKQLLAACLCGLILAGIPTIAASGGEHRAPGMPNIPASGKGHRDHGITSIMTFHTLYGVDGPFVGDANPIRGVNGDELPWVVRGKVFGRLDTEGNLIIVVRGLVFTDDPSVPPELQGTNDETEFRGLVSCLTEVGDTIAEANVVTEGFPATPSGNSVIKTQVELPNPCVAPIIMVVAGSEDKWFAVTGFEAEEEE
jgi:hypothetical protein